MKKIEIVRGAQTFSYHCIIHQEQNDVTLVNGNHQSIEGWIQNQI